MKKTWTVRRWSLCSVALLFLLIALCSFFLLRSPEQPSFSQRLTPEEQEFIRKIVRRHTFVATLETFRSGEFKYGFRRLRDLPRAVIYAQGNQPDGKIWIHVGIPDATQSDGHRLFSRHFLQKKEGEWILVADF